MCTELWMARSSRQKKKDNTSTKTSTWFSYSAVPDASEGALWGETDIFLTSGWTMGRSHYTASPALTHEFLRHNKSWSWKESCRPSWCEKWCCRYFQNSWASVFLVLSQIGIFTKAQNWGAIIFSLILQLEASFIWYVIGYTSRSVSILVARPDILVIRIEVHCQSNHEISVWQELVKWYTPHYSREKNSKTHIAMQTAPPK